MILKILKSTQGGAGLTEYFGYLALIVLGTFMGILALALGSAEPRWIIYFIGGLLGGVCILAVPSRQVLLKIIFILSLQVDVHLRFFYGYADSGGFAVPFVVIAGGVLLLWYAMAGQLNEFHWGGSMVWTIATLFITTLLALLTTSERFVGICELWDRLELYFLYWLVFNMVNSDEDFKLIIHLLIITLAIQSFIYLIQSIFGVTFDLVGSVRQLDEVPRPGGTVSTNPAGFASFIMPALLIAIANFVARENLINRQFVFLALSLGTIAIGLTYTRVPWTGFSMAVIFVVILGYRRRLIKVVMIGWIIFVAAIAVAIFLPSLAKRVEIEYGTEGIVTALDERSGLIEIAMNIITSHPITGVGPGAYHYVFHNYIPEGMDQWIFTVHNEFLLRAAETGIPGVVAFMAFLFIGFKVALRLLQSDSTFIKTCALGWFGALSALVWQMNWVPWNGWSYNAMLWIMLGLMDGAQRLIAPKSDNLILSSEAWKIPTETNS